MAYGDSQGSVREWCWDAPRRKVADRFQAPAVAVGNSVCVLGLEGQWNNCRVWMRAPAAWLDLVWELWGIVGGIFVLLDARSLRAASPSSLDGGVTSSAIVLTACGVPCDSFEVRMRGSGAAAAGLAELGMMAWGEETACGDGGGGGPVAGVQRISVDAGVPFIQALPLSGAVRLKEIYGLNVAAAGTPTLYMQFFDQVAVLAGGEVPTVTAVPVNPTQIGSWSVPDPGDQFANGLRIGLSTTPATFTAAGASLLATVYYDT